MKNSPSLGSLRLWAPAAVLVAAFSLSYAPDVGRGFIKDDFRWILESRVQAPADIVRPFVDKGRFGRLGWGRRHRAALTALVRYLTCFRILSTIAVVEYSPSIGARTTTPPRASTVSRPTI